MNDKPRQSLHHLTIPVRDIDRVVEWYPKRFDCELKYRGATWAQLKFANNHLTLVTQEQHPTQVGLTDLSASD